MAHERIKPEFLFDEEKIKALKKIAPECFEDGKLNFDTLRQNLGDWVQDEDDGELEHFGLFWPGKKDARRLAAIPPEGTLEPVYGEGLKSDGTADDDGVNDSKNIFIEGENFEVLKILQKSYANKIKMIYIDPPYNTGNDFVYDDDFTEPLQGYLRRTGQTDEEGKPLTTNKKSDGRFHSQWLSMIYPRLRLAKNMLKEDGMIFISIDDNEIHNLRCVMNEIFGEENFVQQFIWKKSYGGGAKSRHVVGLHEYILMYCKNKEELGFLELPPSDDVLKYYKWEDEKKELRGPYRKQPLATNSMDSRPNLRYPISHEGHEIWPKKQWQWSKERVEDAYKNNDLVFTQKKDGWTVDYKQYLKDEYGKIRGRKPYSVLDGPYTQVGTSEITNLFGNGKVFTFPKPSSLIKYFLDLGDKDDIVLDFFAGSGSTGHALYNKNSEDQGTRKFILVQLPEQCDERSEALKLGYDTISSISIDRLKKVVANIQLKEIDKGFKVLQLTNSNYKKWNNVQGEDISHLEKSLDLFNNSPLREDWNRTKLITELMLLEGFPLDASQSKSTIDSNEIIKVESDMVPNTLLICLDDEVKESLIEELALDSASTFICLDSAVSNQNKLRLSDKGLIKTI